MIKLVHTIHEHSTECRNQNTWCVLSENPDGFWYNVENDKPVICGEVGRKLNLPDVFEVSFSSKYGDGIALSVQVSEDEDYAGEATRKWSFNGVEFDDTCQEFDDILFKFTSLKEENITELYHDDFDWQCWVKIKPVVVYV